MLSIDSQFLKYMNFRTFPCRHLLPLLALSAIAGAAHAQIPVTDGMLIGTVQQSTQQIVQAVENGFRDQTDTLSDKIADLKKGLANAISGAAETTSKASSGAAAVVSEAAQRTASEQATIRNEQRFSGIDPCNVLVSTIGTSEASRTGASATGGGSGGGGPKPAPGGTSGMKEVLDVAEKRAAAGLPEVEAAKSAKAACSTFASAGLRAEACANSGFSASNSAGYPDADIRASTLFDGPQTGVDGTSFKRRLTVDLAGADGTALRALMRNLDQPVQLQSLTKAQRATDAGRQFMALENVFAARMSVAQYPQEAQANLLAAKPELIEMVKQMLKSQDAAHVQTYLNSNAPNWATKGISMAELIALETQRRYMNPDWQLRLLSMTDTDIARENVRMLAMNAWLQSLALDRQIVASVIDSNAAQAAIRSEMMPQLVAANKRAVSR